MRRGMVDTSKMTDAAFIRTLRMRYRVGEQPEITPEEVRRLLNIASGMIGKLKPSSADSDVDSGPCSASP